MSLFNNSVNCGLYEAHFSGLLGQSNVYGLSYVILPDGTAKVLVSRSPHKEKVLCLEYIKEKGNLRPISREVQFAYIPDAAEIVSMAAFSKLGDGGGFVVGITVAKVTGTVASHYFNMYCPWEKDSAYNLESIAHGWSTIELDFIPYHLTHTQICCDGEDRETVFLLSGSDKKVHLYREEKEISITRFTEHSAEKILPEFSDLPSVVLWLDIQHNGQHERITAVGCKNGYLRITVVSLKSCEVVHKWELRHDGPITCVKLFQSQTPSKAPPFGNLQKFEDAADTIQDVSYHLLVTSALEIAVVYRDASIAGFQNQLVLPESDLYDCAICACVADVDWDGKNEILIGTYGQELLAYKYHSPNEVNTDPADTNTNQDKTCHGTLSSEGEYRLEWKRGFSHPILAMQYIDITGDGLCELIVVTVRGIHILQHDLHDALARCMRHLQSITTNTTADKDNALKSGDLENTTETKNTDKTIVEDTTKLSSGQSEQLNKPSEDVLTIKSGDKSLASGKKTVATLKEIAQARSAVLSKSRAGHEGTNSQNAATVERQVMEDTER